MKIEELLNSLAPRVLPQRFSDGEKGRGRGWEDGWGGRGGANLDGPLAVHGGWIKAGVKGRGDDSFVCSQRGVTFDNWEKKKTMSSAGIKTCGWIKTRLSYARLPLDLGMAKYMAENPGRCTSESVMRLISIMLPDDVTSRGLDGGL